MAKRTATRELNHDNWDDEEEEEEAGSFQQASDEALKGRVIKQAKRRITGNDGEVIYLVWQEFLNNVFHKMSHKLLLTMSEVFHTFIRWVCYRVSVNGITATNFILEHV